MRYTVARSNLCDLCGDASEHGRHVREQGMVHVWVTALR